jgi:hypothetical protein
MDVTVWTTIKPELVEFMEDIRYDRLLEERSTIFCKKLKILEKAVAAIAPRRRGEPSLIDIAIGIPEVRELVDVP